MNKLIFTLCLGLSLTACGQQNKEIRATLDQVVAHAEEASLYRNSVDWNKLKPAIYNLAKDANSVEGLKSAFDYMFEALADDHGRVIHNNEMLSYYMSGETKPHQVSVDPEIYGKVQSGVDYKFHGELLNNQIGYLRIVGLAPGNNERDTKIIQSKVCKLIEKGAEKWIIDLRYNGGGNMFPMVEGITAIIGDGTVGGSKGLTAEERSNWKVEGFDFYYDDQTIGFEETCETKSDARIAVLTSVYTASSGEVLAVIFKGRENTKSFGQNTFGLVTVTDWTVISDSTAMTLAVSFYKDRNGVVYDNFVPVDVEMSFVEEPLSKADSCSLAAIEWLEQE